MAASSEGLLTGVIVDIVVCILAFLAFSILRLVPWTQKYYCPRLFVPNATTRPHDLPYNWVSGFLGWMWPVIRYQEPDIIDSAGLDTTIYLRVLSFGVELFLYLTLWCIVAMLPVNLMAGYIDELQPPGGASSVYTFSEFDKCSLANISPGSRRLWVHLICVYAVTIITLWLLHRYSRESVLLRIMFIANSVKGRSSHTVLVTDIPAIADATARNSAHVKQMRRKASCNGETRQGHPLVSVQDHNDPAPPSSRVTSISSTHLPTSTLSHTERSPPSQGPTLIPTQRVSPARPCSRPTSASPVPAVLGSPSYVQGQVQGFPPRPPSGPGAPNGSAWAPPRAGVGANSGRGEGLGISAGTDRPSTAALRAGDRPSTAQRGGDRPSSAQRGGDGPSIGQVIGDGQSSTQSRDGHSSSQAGYSCGRPSNGRVEEVPMGRDRPNTGVQGSPGMGTPAALGVRTTSCAPCTATTYENPTSRDSSSSGASDSESSGKGSGRGGRGGGSGRGGRGGGSGRGGRTSCDGNPRASGLRPLVGPAEAAYAAAGSMTVRNGLRRRRRYNYNLKDASLDARVMASRLISAGLSPKELVEKEFHDVYPNGAVQAVHMVADQSLLEPLVKEFDKLKQSLEDLIDQCEHRYSKGKEVKRKTKLICPLALGEWGRKRYGKALLKSVDALDYYMARLRELDRRIELEQPLSSQMVWPAAFVTFRSRQDQACASTAFHHHDTAAWLTHPAPEPNELLWSNLGMPLAMRSSRSVIMWAAFWAMCFFFMIPVAAVQAIIESPRLMSNPVLGPLVGNAVFGNLLQGLIPGLALKLFLLIVPWILTVMIKFAGATSLSEVDMGVVSRYFVFQVIVVFFGSVIMGSFFNQVEQWVRDPASVISVLGTAIPMVSTFFITYISVDGLLVKPLGFLRGWGLCFFALLTWLSGSRKARDRLWQEQKTELGTTVADHTITILLGLVYSCINPIITPFCLTYFCITLVIERYSNIYITTREYESKGQLWPRVLTQVLAALYIMQITMLGLLGLKKFIYAPLLLPLPVATLAFHIVITRMFSKPWSLMSMHDAAMLDRFDREQEAEEEGYDEPCSPQQLDGNVYLSPVFKVVPGEVEGLLRQAKELSDRIDNGGVPVDSTDAELEEGPEQQGNRQTSSDPGSAA